MNYHVPYAHRVQQPIYIGFEPKKPRNRLGLAGFLFSILGLCTLGLASPIGLLLSGLGMFYRPRRLATFGMLFSLVGTGLLTAGIATARHDYYRQQVYHWNSQTNHVIAKANAAVQNSMKNNHGAVLEGIDGNRITIKFKDVWNRELRYEPFTRANGAIGYSIRSAGADGSFDSDDDIVQQFQIKVVPAERGSKSESEVQI